jgi:hypothetical protein
MERVLRFQNQTVTLVAVHGKVLVLPVTLVFVNQIIAQLTSMVMEWLGSLTSWQSLKLGARALVAVLISMMMAT